MTWQKFIVSSQWLFWKIRPHTFRKQAVLDYTLIGGDSQSFDTCSEVYYHEEIGLSKFLFSQTEKSSRLDDGIVPAIPLQGPPLVAFKSID